MLAALKTNLNDIHQVTVMNRRVRVLAGHLADQITGGGSVLDVGCGDGSIAQAIMARNGALVFQGVDVFLRPRVAIPAQVYDGATLPFGDAAFDWVTIVDVLHHTDDPGRVLAECLRVARRGVVVKDHLRDGLAAETTLRFMDWVGNRGHDVRLPYNYLSTPDWRALFARIGARAARWTTNLGLYPAPFSLLFDRGLHVVATIEKA